MELERERGITIQSAATHCEWKGLPHQHHRHPRPRRLHDRGRARRCACSTAPILVLCAVAGVQSQSLTVDRQMRRYKVPRIAFVNKCDRTGANPLRVRDQLREKLKHNPVLMQLPIGLEDKLEGVVDLVDDEGVPLRRRQRRGHHARRRSRPSCRRRRPKAREEMLDAVSMFSDELTEAILEERVTEELIRAAIRKGDDRAQAHAGVHGLGLQEQGRPAAARRRRRLPARARPRSRTRRSTSTRTSRRSCSRATPTSRSSRSRSSSRTAATASSPTCASTRARSQGRQFIINTRTGRRSRSAGSCACTPTRWRTSTTPASGDIVALFGIDCNSGDTFTDGTVKLGDDVDARAGAGHLARDQAEDTKSETNMAKALRRFTKEDPTFRAGVDEESSETIIPGMGELHLDVYIERMKREYNARSRRRRRRSPTARPITQRAEFNYTHKKQTGGSGQYGRVGGYIEPCEQAFEFVDDVAGGAIPREFISVGREGLQARCSAKGRLLGFPVVGRARRHQRRREPRGRLVRHRVPGGRARRLPRGLRPRRSRGSSSRS